MAAERRWTPEANGQTRLSQSEIDQTIDAAQGDDRDCKSQSSEWEESLKSRADEILAIYETIKLLNDDHLLEIFKSTLPSSSAVQVNQSTSAVGRRAMDEICRSSRTHSNSVSNLKMISLALSGKSVDFSKIISMINEMVTLRE